MGDPSANSYRFKRAPGGILLIACGALAREVVYLVEKNAWHHIDISCLPAKLHYRPALIPEAVREKIRENKGKYHQIFVLYGDCGTGGLLDLVLAEEGGVERIPGPHCFSFYQGNQLFEDNSSDDLRTFFLTDYFCRHFEKFVWQALGLDRRPDMKDFVFGNYEKLVFQAQQLDPELKKKSQEIAAKLGLKYEYRFVGFGDMDAFLMPRAGDSSCPS